MINTCGWIDGDGFDLLLWSIDKMEVDYVLVIDNDRLYSDLTTNYEQKNKNLKIIKLQKSGGVRKNVILTRLFFSFSFFTFFSFFFFLTKQLRFFFFMWKCTVVGCCI